MTVPARLQPYLFAAIACLGLAAYASYDLYREWDRSIAQAKANTANLARLLDEHTRISLLRVADVLADAEARLGDTAEVSPGSARLQALEQALKSSLPRDGLVSALAWRDNDARTIASTTPLAARASADEAFGLSLPGLRANPPATLAFGRPARDASGAWQMPVARSVVAHDGRPAGTLAAVVNLGVLQPVLDAVDTGRNGFVTLFLADGWMLATAPRNEALLARNWSFTPMFKDHLPRSPVGTVQQVVVRDGTERVYSYRALSEYPVVVSTGISMPDALVDWRTRAVRDALLLAVVSGALLLGAAAMARTYGRQQAAERASAEAAAKMQAIVDHAADAIVTYGADGRIESANQACSVMFGHDAHDLAGQPLGRLLPGLAAPDTAAGAPRSPAHGRYESLGRHADGSEFPIELAITDVLRADRPLRIALIRDIANRRKTQAEIADARDEAQRSERFLRAITDNLPLRIAYVDRELRYRFVNKAHCDRFGLPREAIIGRTRQELTGRAAPPILMRNIELALAGQAQRFEIDEPGVATGMQVLEYYLVPDFDADGKVLGFYAASSDVTERHLQQRRIERALAERETLLREVYHRVKNNLQVIQSLLNLQRRSLPEGPARGALDESIGRVYAMALVHERLYQTGNFDAIALRDYSNDLLRHLGDTAGAAQRGIELRAEVEAFEASLEVALPFGLLLTELVSNSLKHGFPDGRAGCIRIGVRREGSHVWLRVSDDGVGLPAGFAIARSESMGLQLAASLARQLGGTLQARSEGGAEFATALTCLA